MNVSDSAARIARDVERLSGPAYTTSSEAIRRYAYIDAYRNTLDYVRAELKAVGFESYEDPVGNFVARNRPRGEPVFGIGSHCDSNRNGGKYDGTLGVLTAIEVCRLSAERGLGLPLQVISFLEEEGSAFGELLLGSRIVAQRVTEEELGEIRALDDGQSFFEHAMKAGLQPGRWRESARILDDLTGWVEVHIEQGRVLQDAGKQIGIVTAIAGYAHVDITIVGRADHAGATPMDSRIDAGVAAALVVAEVEELARRAGAGTVGTVGGLVFEPGLRNVIPGSAHMTLDIRGVYEAAFRRVTRDSIAFAEEIAQARGASVRVTQRQTEPPTVLDERLVATLTAQATEMGVPFMTLPSGAIHDTALVAERVPSAMLFVPCKDGISHSPREEARSEDAAFAAELLLASMAARA